MNQIKWLGVSCLCMLLSFSASASELQPRESVSATSRADRIGTIASKKLEQLLHDLDETIWCALEEHTRLDVDSSGVVSTKEGKNVCVTFTREGDQLLTVVEWWNESRNIYVIEYAIAVAADRNRLEYIEASHSEDSGFPGIAGRGTMTIYGSTLHMTQLGHLADGTASGFSNYLVRVDEPPEIPVPLTYPSE